MNRISCYFERISDFAVGLFLLFVGLALTVVSFTIIPIIGLFIAIPVLVLAVAQKEQGVCVDRRPNQKYFIDLTASDKSYIVYLR
jgi:hypothetical protein